MRLADVVVGTRARVSRITDGGLIEGIRAPEAFDTEVSSFTVDSRLSTPGTVFFALRGETFHGRDFVADALSRGAVAAVVDRPVDLTHLPPNSIGSHILIADDPLSALQHLARYWRQKHDTRVIGVTGSVGKTTAKEAIAHALKPLGEGAVLKSQANLNTEIGLPLELLRLTSHHRAAVLEMGMYQPGDIGLLAEIAKPEVGVVTNVQESHLERTGSIERTAQGKAELVHALPREGLALLNGDDPLVRAMAWATPARACLYGTASRCLDFWCGKVTGHGSAGFDVDIHHGSRSIECVCPTAGVHNAMNLLPAVAVAHRLGVGWQEIGDLLRTFRLESRGRFLPGVNGCTILDDGYNASATSVLAALTLLREEPAPRHMALLGEMYELGAAEESQHRAVGRAAGDLDGLILIGPRTRWIAEEALAAGLREENLIEVRDNERAVEAAVGMLGRGDVMLVKGSRGLRLETVVQALSAPQ